MSAWTLAGTVTGPAKGSGLTVETPAGALVLDLETRLPAGSRLHLELLIPTRDAPASAPAGLVHRWPALEESLRVLGEGMAPAQPETPPLERIPRPGPRLTSGILFFLSALGAGDLSAWLGKTAAEALKARSRGDLIRQLGQDLTQLGRLSDAAGGDWRFLPFPLFDGQQVQQLRLLPFPLFDGQQVQQLRLFLRRDRGRDEAENADDGGEAATRFVVEVELVRLGDMQLDGLVRAHRFDLILRTRTALPRAMRDDIAAIFRDANEIAGHRGRIAFQASSDWTFIPLDVKAAAPGLIV